MTKLTAQAKQKRDEIADQLVDATSGRFRITKRINDMKFYLFSRIAGENPDDAGNKAENLVGYISTNFPYVASHIPTNGEFEQAEIWVRKR